MTVRATAAEGLNELQQALADDRAFESWHRRALPRVYSYVLSRCAGDTYLAEELTQQTFIAAIEQRARYDARSDVVTWLCGIARHKVADHARTAEREERRHRRMVVREIHVDAGTGPERGVEDRTLILQALRSLPPGQRSVLTLVVLDDLPVAEAARVLRKSRSATESLLFRARESFRRAYERVIEP